MEKKEKTGGRLEGRGGERRLQEAVKSRAAKHLLNAFL